MKLPGGFDFHPAAVVPVTITQERNETLEERNFREASAAKEFAVESGAIPDWTQSIPKARRGFMRFTIDVSRALIRINGQPVLLRVYLKDLYEKGVLHIIRFLN